jgi:protein-tyrosine-phosphatase
MDLPSRARIHAALGDETRLRLIDALWLNDRSPRDLGRLLDVDSNLLAHHLDVLEEAGVVARTVSAGDRRRRYVSARLDVLDGMVEAPRVSASTILFVCTHNSARSLFAEKLLSELGSKAQSAGTQPAEHAHPKAVAAAADLGIDLAGSRPKAVSAVEQIPDLVVSVCDRARESRMPFRVERLHWSIPDPVDTGRIESFRNAFAEISSRVERLNEILEKEE